MEHQTYKYLCSKVWCGGNRIGLCPPGPRSFRFSLIPYSLPNATVAVGGGVDSNDSFVPCSSYTVSRILLPGSPGSRYIVFSNVYLITIFRLLYLMNKPVPTTVVRTPNNLGARRSSLVT